MSTCISREGEYSEHQLGGDEEFVCTRCFAFDERAAVAEVARLRGVITNANAVEDESDNEAYYVLVGRMRGILERGLKP
jgi:hypothetical protein